MVYREGGGKAGVPEPQFTLEDQARLQKGPSSHLPTPSGHGAGPWHGTSLSSHVPHPRTGLTPGQTSALKSRLTSAESLPQPLQMGAMSPHPLEQPENPAPQKGLLWETRSMKFWQAAPPLPHSPAAVLCPAMTLPAQSHTLHPWRRSKAASEVQQKAFLFTPQNY